MNDVLIVIIESTKTIRSVFGRWGASQRDTDDNGGGADGGNSLEINIASQEKRKICKEK